MGKLLDGFYSGNYKRYLVPPLLLFLVFAFLAFVYPGIPKGIDLKGGTLIIVRAQQPIDAGAVENALAAKYDLTELSVTSIASPAGYGLTVKFSSNKLLDSAAASLALAESTKATDAAASLTYSQAVVSMLGNYIQPVELSTDAAKAAEQAGDALIEAEKNINSEMQNAILQAANLPAETAYQRREVSPTLGESFWQTAFSVGIVAVFLVVIVIFLFFRKVIPSVAVIAAAAFDMLGALALMSIFGIALSLSSIPALLMLIGYSIDTDMLLTTRVLTRSERTPRERASDSMRTGLTMTFTTIAALAVMLVLSYFNQITVIFEIAAVILFGLLADIIATWMMNAAILLWYVEKTRGL